MRLKNMILKNEQEIRRSQRDEQKGLLEKRKM